MAGIPWLVCDMDNGVLRSEPTRRAARQWCLDHALADRVRQRHYYGNHCYDYVVGTADPYEGDDFFVGRADQVARHGYDPQQPPRYPDPDRPHEPVDDDPETASATETAAVR